MKKEKMKKYKFSLFMVLICTLLAVWTIIFFAQIIWGAIAANKSIVNFFMDPVGFPKKEWGGWQWGNWAKVFTDMKVRTKSGEWVYFLEMFKNTLFYVLVYALVSTLCPMLCSYVYAKFSDRVPFVRVVWWLVLIGMYVPLSASLAASLNLAYMLNYYDNIFLFVVCYASGFGGDFLIYYATWKGLSREYIEAATIDGAGNFTILFRIMFPLIITIFWVLYLKQIIVFWADYYTPMVFLPSTPTLAYGVFSYQSSVEAGSSVPIKIAALLVVAAPMFALFMIFREKMMGSLTIGGLKG